MFLKINQNDSERNSKMNVNFEELKFSTFSFNKAFQKIQKYLNYVSKILLWFRLSLVVAMLFFLLKPSLVSADYSVNQFTDSTFQIFVATDENAHAMTAYSMPFNSNSINTYYFDNNVWNNLLLNTAIGNVSDLVMAPGGLALLTYIDDANNDLRSYYFNGTMWNIPANDPIDTAIIRGGDLAINASGLGVTVWSDSTNDIRVSFFSSGNWGTPSLPAVIGTGDRPLVSINAAGDLIVAWQDDVLGGVSVRHYIAGVWSATSTNLPTANLRGVGISAGKSLVLTSDGLTSDVRASYFQVGVLDSTTTLNPPQPNTLAIFGSILEMAPNGTAVATWQYNQTFFGQYDLYYAQFDGTTWAPAVNFQPNGPDSTAPALSLNSLGDALLFWGNFPGFTLNTARLPVGGILTTPVSFRTAITKPDSLVVSLADNDFNALAWFEDLGEGGNPFGAIEVAAAPTELQATSCSDRNKGQGNCVIILTWDPSVDPNVASYNLLRDNIFIANILASGPLTYNDPVACNATFDYTLKAVDNNGVEGVPVTITTTSYACCNG